MVDYKLVREKIPELIERNGGVAVFHVASDFEYKGMLMKKFREEADEFAGSGRIGELADILEVVYSFCDFCGFGINNLERVREEKARGRGGFGARIILDEVRQSNL
ncbi:nucleoside triphosphate pyrophosphohydrolase [Candidatus Pacearchaeota archaeon]|nr:nucleoside triphosphate pyrophosphohydrolase [Candidatus Pacearchaeota archaeon]